MKEKIYEIIVYISPLIAGFITSIIIPIVVERFSIKHLNNKINEISPSTEYKEIKKELKEIKKEILEMRGKIK